MLRVPLGWQQLRHRPLRLLVAVTGIGFAVLLIMMLLGYRTRSILCLPIRNRHGEVFAVAQLLNRRSGESFAAEDETRLAGFLDSLGVVLESLQASAERLEGEVA